jgi:hypothetical protein
MDVDAEARASIHISKRKTITKQNLYFTTTMYCINNKSKPNVKRC